MNKLRCVEDVLAAHSERVSVQNIFGCNAASTATHEVIFERACQQNRCKNNFSLQSGNGISTRISLFVTPH